MCKKPLQIVWVAALVAAAPLGLETARAQTRPSTTPATAPAADGDTSSAQARWWLRAAVEHAAAIRPEDAPPAEGAVARPPGAWREGILSNALFLQVQGGDAAGAVAAAKRLAPDLLWRVAQAQAAVGDVDGALATVREVPDEQGRHAALGAVASSLIDSARPIEGLRPAEPARLRGAQRVLEQRAVDELTGSLYERLATEYAKQGEVAAAREALGKLDGPGADGLDPIRRADALVALAAAHARAGDCEAYRECLAEALDLSQDFRPPYADNIRGAVAAAQFDAGDEVAAAATLADAGPQLRERLEGLSLAARVRRGEVTPAEALARVTRPGYSRVYAAAMEAQLAAGDHEAAAETFAIAQGQDFHYTPYPARIIDAFVAVGDAEGAFAFANGTGHAPGRAKLHARLASQLAAAGDRPGYRRAIERAVALAGEIVDLPPDRARSLPLRRDVLKEIARVQMGAGDFDGARDTVARIDHGPTRSAAAVTVQARELASRGALEEARAWMESLPNPWLRAEASMAAARQLLGLP